jgi:hypothetical protein
MGFLGNIEQAEIAIEYPYYLADGLGVQAFYRFQQMLPSGQAPVAQQSGDAALQLLNRGGDFRPGLGFQYPRQHGAQQADRVSGFFIIKGYVHR